MLVIGNGRMITQDASNPFLENGAVAMDGNTIVMVGVTEEVKKVYPDAEFVDAKGGVIMPAFINAHEHIYSSFARGLSINGYNPQGFLDILDGLWWTVDRHLTLEQTKLSAYATYIDSIKNGVTTVFDHHASFGHITGSLNAIEEATKDLGVRTCLCYEISDRDGMEKSRESVMENVNFIKHALADDSDMIALNLTFTRQWIDCLAHIMCSNHFLNLTCFLIQDTHLRRIAVGYMGNRIRHICAKRICLCKIFPIINFTDHIINGLTCIAVLHNLIAGSAAGFPCYQSLSGTGSCT